MAPTLWTRKRYQSRPDPSEILFFIHSADFFCSFLICVTFFLQDFLRLLYPLAGPLCNFSNDVRDHHARWIPADLTSNVQDSVETLVKYAFFEREGARANPPAAPLPGLYESLKGMEAHSRVKSSGAGSGVSDLQYQKYAAGLVEEFERQKLYVPALLLLKSAQTIRSRFHCYYRNRRIEGSVYWNEVEGSSLVVKPVHFNS